MPVAQAPSTHDQPVSTDALHEAATLNAPGRVGATGRRVMIIIVLVAIAASLYASGVGRVPIARTSGLPQLAEFLGAAVHPRLDSEFLRLTCVAVLTTLAYAVLGTILALGIGFVGGVLTSQTWWGINGARRGRGKVASWAGVRVLLAMPRGIHEVVWGLCLLSVFGIQPIVAVLAIAIPFGAITAKVFSELLDEVARQPYEALRAVGVARLPAMVYGILPAALADLCSYGFYRFECAIRSAAILGLIGAGGLGFQLSLSFQALVYPEIWTFLYALILLCALSDLWSSAVRRRQAQGHRGLRRDPVMIGSLTAVAVLIPASVWWIGLDVSVLWAPQTWSLTGQLIGEAWPPSLGDASAAGLFTLSASTLGMSILAITVAFLGGSLLAFPAARQSLTGGRRHRPVVRFGRMIVTVAARAVLIVLRAIPPPVWALLMLFVFYPGIIPGVLALGLYTIGVLGRLMAEATENLDQRPLHALRAGGAPQPLVFCYGMIPAAAPRFVAFGLYRWEVTIRETVVVGVVGAGGLGLLLSGQLTAFDYSAALTTLIVLMLLTALVDLISATVRRTVR